MKKLFLFVGFLFATMSFANNIEVPEFSETTILTTEVTSFNDKNENLSERNSKDDQLIICYIYTSIRWVGSGVSPVTGIPYDTYEVTTWGSCHEFGY